MLLGESQAIYLFELGSNVSVNPYTQPELLTAAQDFQDLVVLVTMAPETQELVTGTVSTGAIDGSININPNNNPHSIFELTKLDDTMIDRDDLHNATTADLDASGVYYNGSAKKIRIKPKGNGAPKRDHHRRSALHAQEQHHLHLHRPEHDRLRLQHQRRRGH